MSRHSHRGSRRNLLIIAGIVLMFLLLAAVYPPTYTSIQPTSSTHQPSNPLGVFEQVAEAVTSNPVIRSFGEALGLIEPEEVGIYAELGYQSTTGESIVFQSLSGYRVGFVGLSGIYVKPSLGSYKALKLYDEQTEKEGAIWVRPIIKIAVLKGTPEYWQFTTKIKIKSDRELLATKQLARQGKGSPPKKIVLDKLEVKGRALQLLLMGEKELAKQIIMGCLLYTSDAADN